MPPRTVAVGSRRLEFDPSATNPAALGLMRESNTSETTAALQEKLARDGALLCLTRPTRPCSREPNLLDANPQRLLGRLPAAQQQMCASGRALGHRAVRWCMVTLTWFLDSAAA